MEHRLFFELLKVSGCFYPVGYGLELEGGHLLEYGDVDAFPVHRDLSYKRLIDKVFYLYNRNVLFRV